MPARLFLSSGDWHELCARVLSGKVKEARAERAALDGADNGHSDQAGAAASKDQAGTVAEPNRRAAMVAASHRKATKAGASHSKAAKAPAPHRPAANHPIDFLRFHHVRRSPNMIGPAHKFEIARGRRVGRKADFRTCVWQHKPSHHIATLPTWPS
jgi:hypothetical protein